MIDGRTLGVAFSPPQLDGGDKVTFYRVQYTNSWYVDEVQQLAESCSITNDVQVISTVTDHTVAEVQLLQITDKFVSGADAVEVPTVYCDAEGGSFQLTFAGFSTPSIAYDDDANAQTIINALQAIDIIDTVSVVFTGGVSQACNMRAGFPLGGFEVTFTAIADMMGNLQTMTAKTNNLLGSRYISILETTAGNARSRGSFRFKF